MELTLDARTRELLDEIRYVGRNYFRPLGLGCDRRQEPLPAEHPFYGLIVRSGWADRDAEQDPEHGIAGYPFARSCILTEEAAYWDPGVTLSLPGPGLAGTAVQRLGTPQQRERLLGRFRDLDRARWAGFALSEPDARDGGAHIRTRCRRDGEGWVLEGKKMLAVNARRADWVAVWASTDPDRGPQAQRVFVVERGTPGLEISGPERKMGLRACETCSVVLQSCRVPPESLLGGEEAYTDEPHREPGGAGAAFDATSVRVAIQGVGIARAAFDRARDFVHEEYPRHGARRAVALERLAEARRSTETARLLCLRAAWLLDRDQPNTVQASLARLYTASASLRAVTLAMEVFGEAGVRRERIVEKLYRDVAVIDILEGGQQQRHPTAAGRLFGLRPDDA